MLLNCRLNLLVRRIRSIQMSVMFNLQISNMWFTLFFVYNKLSIILNLRLTVKIGCLNAEYRVRLVVHFASPDIYVVLSLFEV